ncbi:BatD family protein [Aurantivibrio plasticivorans]
MNAGSSIINYIVKPSNMMTSMNTKYFKFTTLRPLLVCLNLFLLITISLPSFAAVFSAEVDRTVITEDESLLLTLHINEQIGYGGPDLTLLEEDFDILNQQRSNQFRSLNGRTEAWTEWTISLSPKRHGKLLIPSFSFSGSFTDAIEITVNQLTATNNESRDIFATVSTEKEAVYVQEQLLVTVRLHTAVDLREITVEKDLVIDGATVEHVSEVSYRKNINGRLYKVVEMVYAVYPQQSGELTIPELAWNALVVNNRWRNDPFRASRGTLRRIKSLPTKVAVESKPDSYTGNLWLPAKNVRLEQHWSSDPKRFVVGEPLTRRISIIAEGLSAAQLPPFDEPMLDDIKIYSDQPQLDEQKSSSGIVGSRHESLAIVPTRSGNITLPAIDITWWNTATGRQEVATLPSQTIQVAPAPVNNPMATNLASPALSTQPGADNSNVEQINSEISGDGFGATPLHLWISNALFAVLAAVFFIAWLNARTRSAHKPLHDETAAPEAVNEKQLFNELRKSCADNQADQARHALCQWARRHWHLAQQPSLENIKLQFDDEKLNYQLDLLDKTLYSNNNDSDWDGTALWTALTAAKRAERKRKNSESTSHDDLPPLYPSTR